MNARTELSGKIQFIATDLHQSSANETGEGILE